MLINSIKVHCDGTGNIIGMIPLYAIPTQEHPDEEKLEITLITREGPSHIISFQNTKGMPSIQSHLEVTILCINKLVKTA